MSKQSIRFYNDHEVRAIWSDAESKWYFSIVDIVSAITESPRPRVYWGTMKNRQKERFAQLYSKCIQLKLTSADGKRYATDYLPHDAFESIYSDCNEIIKILSSITKTLKDGKNPNC